MAVSFTRQRGTETDGWAERRRRPTLRMQCQLPTGTTLFLGHSSGGAQAIPSVYLIGRQLTEAKRSIKPARRSNTLVIRPGRYHFRDYRKLELPLTLIAAGLGAFDSALLAARSIRSELAGRYRVDRGGGHDQRASGT